MPTPRVLALILLCLSVTTLPGVGLIRAESEVPGRDLEAQGEAQSTKLPGNLAATITVDPSDTPAALVLRNRQIVTLRARYGGISPQERVQNAKTRFQKAVERKGFPDVTMKRYKPAALFLIGDTPILGITESDLDPLGGESLEQVGSETLAKLNVVLAEIREQRDLKAFLRALGSAVVGTLLLAALLFAVGRLERFLERRLLGEGRAADRTAGGVSLTSVRAVALIVHRAVRILGWAARLFLAYLWVALTLRLFPYTRPWGERLGMYLVFTFEAIALGILRALPKLFIVAVVVLIARFLNRIIRAFFQTVESGRLKPPWMHPEIVLPTRRILTVIVWIFALVAVYPYLPGSGSEAFKGVSVLLGLMVSLGGTGVISQAMSGLVLMYSRALCPGDYVRICDAEGVVISLGMLATKIRTPMHEEVTIPNSVILAAPTKNFSRLAGVEGVILYTTVTIGYAEPWRKVHQQLIVAAERTPGLKKEPRPFVTQTALSDFSVEYRLNAYLERPEERLTTLGALHANIQDALNEAGVVIVSPHYVADPPRRSPARSE